MALHSGRLDKGEGEESEETREVRAERGGGGQEKEEKRGQEAHEEKMGERMRLTPPEAHEEKMEKRMGPQQDWQIQRWLCCSAIRFHLCYHICRFQDSSRVYRGCRRSITSSEAKRTSEVRVWSGVGRTYSIMIQMWWASPLPSSAYTSMVRTHVFVHCTAHPRSATSVWPKSVAAIRSADDISHPRQQGLLRPCLPQMALYITSMPITMAPIMVPMLLALCFWLQ